MGLLEWSGLQPCRSRRSMTGPRIDPRISWGNIASLVATVLTAIAMLAAKYGVVL